MHRGSACGGLASPDLDPFLPLSCALAVMRDRAAVLAEVLEDGRNLQNAPKELQKDAEIVRAAVQQNGFALQYADPELRRDADICMEAIRQNGLAVLYADTKLRIQRDGDLVLEAHASVARHRAKVEERLRVRREVEFDGRSLRAAPAHLRANHDLVRLAVRGSGYALQYAAPPLRARKDVVLAAITENGRAIRYADSSLKTNSEMLESAAASLSMERYSSAYVQTSGVTVEESRVLGPAVNPSRNENLVERYYGPRLTAFAERPKTR